jgi:hypothetical protein
MCPAPYPGCPASLEASAPPAHQNVCSAAELANFAAACAGGPDTTTCGDLFHADTDAACIGCLQNFAFFVSAPLFNGAEVAAAIDVPRSMQYGIRACAAPYVDAACNHNSGCIADCLSEACLFCFSSDAASMAQCESQAQSGVCASYFESDACLTTALQGAAAFCDPATYQGSFGAWLQGVGTRYCGK